MHPDWQADSDDAADPSEFTLFGGTMSVRVDLSGAWALTDSDPATWTNGPLVTELHLPSADRSFSITQCNVSAHVLPAEVPAIEIMSNVPLIWWMGGVCNYVARSLNGQITALVPLGGAYTSTPIPGGLRITPTHLPVLSPGQENLSIWRWTGWSTPESFAAQITPDWYPESAVVDVGDEITLRHLDGVVHAPDLQVFDDFPNTLLTGPPGIHRATVIQAAGGSDLFVGWAPPLDGLVRDALDGELDPDLRGWFTAWLMAREGKGGNDALDELDSLIGHALVDPTPWSVLAAAAACPLLGRGMIADGASGLEAILASGPLPSGTHLAGLSLYAQALGAESHAADEIIEVLWADGGAAQMERDLLTENPRKEAHVQNLAATLGHGLPGFVPRGRAREVALLKVALDGKLPPDLVAPLAALYLQSERWVRACMPEPADLAWLLW